MAVMGMVLPPLSSFVQAAPASRISCRPHQWLEDCLAGGGDLVVLLDDEHLPIGALRLHQLCDALNLSVVFGAMATSEESRTKDSRAASALPSQESLVFHFLDIEIVNVSNTASDVVQQVGSKPNLCWVVVDENRRYLGLLDKTHLLAAALATLSSNNDDAEKTVVQPSNFTTKASEKNTALLTYLGHELKTPLTSLLGLASLLRTGNFGELSPRQNRYISLIQQHCRRLATWVNTLIDLGRLENGTLQLLPQVLELNQLWQDAYRQAALRVGKESGSGPFPLRLLNSQVNSISLVADPARLQQMLSCLIQAALSTQQLSSTSAFPLEIELLNDWIFFSLRDSNEVLALDRLLQAISTPPLPETAIPSTSIAGEIGHWLEWLLVRKLAQQHQGEFLLSMHHPDGIVRPTLVLPVAPKPTAAKNSRFLVAVAALNQHSLPMLYKQVEQLNYRLFLTSHLKDAIAIDACLPVSALLVLIDSRQTIRELKTLEVELDNTRGLSVALVLPGYSSWLGELPVDREVLWPTDGLGNVLLQPPPIVSPPSRLTILYLRGTEPLQSDNSLFPSIFHDFGCRVLEVDDLEQANLLCRVWRPNVAIIDPGLAAPQAYLRALGRSPRLASIPLVTLTMATTQAAHATPTLTVFPCLVAESSWTTPEAVERLSAWLIQVLQTAASKNM